MVVFGGGAGVPGEGGKYHTVMHYHHQTQQLKGI